MTLCNNLEGADCKRFGFLNKNLRPKRVSIKGVFGGCGDIDFDGLAFSFITKNQEPKNRMQKCYSRAFVPFGKITADSIEQAVVNALKLGQHKKAVLQWLLPRAPFSFRNHSLDIYTPLTEISVAKCTWTLGTNSLLLWRTNVWWFFTLMKDLGFQFCKLNWSCFKSHFGLTYKLNRKSSCRSRFFKTTNSNLHSGNQSWFRSSHDLLGWN